MINQCLAIDQKSVLTDTTYRLKDLYIVKFPDKAPTLTLNCFISWAEAANVEVLPDAETKTVCKQLDVDHVLVFTVESRAQIVTLNQIFVSYKIPLSYQNLQVKVNDKVIQHPETILISKSQIESVKVRKGQKNRYIHITFIGYNKKNNSDPLNSDLLVK